MLFEKLSNRMKIRPNNGPRDVVSGIRKKALEISKGDIQLHNQSCIEKYSSPKVPQPEWSFGILAENNGNDRLQKIYEIYQKVLSQSKMQGQHDSPILPISVSANVKPGITNLNNSGLGSANKQTNSEDSGLDIRIPHPPSKPKGNAQIYDSASRVNSHVNRSVHKSSSPYAVKLDSHIRPSTRSQVRKKSIENVTSNSTRKTTSRINDRHESAASSNANKKNGNGSAVGPITIIQAPLINTFNNYNSFNIGNISLNQIQPGAEQILAGGNQVYPAPSSATKPPVVSNFRTRKYKNANTAVKSNNKHNLSLAK